MCAIVKYDKFAYDGLIQDREMIEQISNVNRLVKSYTNALFEIAVSSGQVDNINNELSTIEKIIFNNGNLLKILNAVIVLTQDKLTLIEGITLTHKISDTVKSFVSLLVSNNRFMYFNLIRELFEKYRCELMGEKILTCVSAISLSEDNKDQIIQKLEKIFNQKLSVKFTLDKEIIAGMVIRDGNIIYDCSIKNKLTIIEKQSINYINAI